MLSLNRLLTIIVCSLLVSLTLLNIACTDPLDKCLEGHPDAFTKQEAAECYELARDWTEEQDANKQRDIIALLQSLPTPVPTSTPVPPTTEVGFLQFQYHNTEQLPEPADQTWFTVRNISGTKRTIDHGLWSARDSKGNKYGPYLFTWDSLMEVRQTGEGECWHKSIGHDYRIEPRVTGCLVGFTWFLSEPNALITEVKYNGKKLPINIDLARIPTPSPPREGPTTEVGFLQFEYYDTEKHPDPADQTWFIVRNISGVKRTIDHGLWSAKDSNGNKYGPYLLTWNNLMGVRQIGDENCGRQIIGMYDYRIEPQVDGCLVGFTWNLVEPNATITEVNYNGEKLPLK